MTPEFFQKQISRLKLRFSDKAFDPEFVKLIGHEVSSMGHDAFQRLVDIMIGTRAHNRPPTITDFREMRVQSDKHTFTREVQGAANAMDKHWGGDKEAALAKAYGSDVKTLKEAFKMQLEINKLNRIKQGEE